MRHPADRLAALPDSGFASFVERLGRVWPAFDATVSPVTPEGTVELSLTRDRPDAPPERAVVRVTRASVSIEDVNDLAAFAAERGLSFAVLATVDEVDPDAARRARTAPIEVYDGVGLVGLAREADVSLPQPESGGSDASDPGDDSD
ncbi:restriction endonuclease [Halobaculum gomorrense]|uniref:Restriction endonuclease n=1 Tax=Halobaculum gomorrense TaxID=43928 RepID=A0A1M5RPN2_9EURY|nr:restriction endonuclease [Halobaculum gomorrense]SHH28110.1 Restriction endonuclease [Halobaculum gomorrense]